MNIYDFINRLFIYSFLGYLLECIVPNAEYKWPVMNHGFGHGPSCIIYGFGAPSVRTLLQPVSDSPMESYTASMVMAITMELVTANIMVRLFGSLWQDYSYKPLSHKGMICLENSLGWGLLGLFFFYFLGVRVRAAVFGLPGHIGPVLAVELTMFYLADLIHYFRLRLSGMGEEDTSAVGRLETY